MRSGRECYTWEIGVRHQPCKSAAMPTIISTAFPKDALRSPDNSSPRFMDSWSVAVPNSWRKDIWIYYYLKVMLRYCHEIKLTAARGTIATKLNEKRKEASQSIWCATILKGTNTRKMLNHEPNRKNWYDFVAKADASRHKYDKKQLIAIIFCWALG